MSKREIITVELRPEGEEPSEEEILLGHGGKEVDVRVQNREIREIIADIKAVMKEKNLVSLSAPALGHDKRIFCIKFDGDIKAFINPIIVKNTNGLQLSREKCSSLPGKEYILPRNNDITVWYQKATGEAETRRMVGIAACVFQHEVGHLDGMLISDIGQEIVPEEFDAMSDEEKEQLVAEYLDTLDLKKKELEREYEENEEYRKLKDGVDYMESVVRGETKLATKEDMDVKE